MKKRERERERERERVFGGVCVSSLVFCRGDCNLIPRDHMETDARTLGLKCERNRVKMR